MRKWLIGLAATLIVASPARAASVEWRNGRWFDGDRFVSATRYSVDASFVASRPAKLDRVVELGARHVVPAYGDAHHHGIDSDDGIDDKITVFLEAGIFYVKNPNAIPQLITPAVRAKLNKPYSVDVSFSNGGLTSH